MTTLRLESLAGLPLDLLLPRCVLWRRGDAVRLTLEDAAVTRVRRELAFRGVRTRLEVAGVPEPPPLVRAVGIGLAPVKLGDRELDIIEVEVVPLSEATTRSLRRPVRHWPLGQRRRAQCRALLRATDALIEVRRTAWCTRETLRSGRRSLRPAFFDSAAASRTQRIRASEGRLARWIEG